jgi:DNA helicase TIP49 (TBP-interacting protein)
MKMSKINVEKKDYTAISLEYGSVHAVGRTEAWEISSHEEYVVLSPEGDLVRDGEVHAVDRS